MEKTVDNVENSSKSIPKSGRALAFHRGKPWKTGFCVADITKRQPCYGNAAYPLFTSCFLLKMLDKVCFSTNFYRGYREGLTKNL